MQYLTRDQILEAEDLLSEDVEVPEWGGVVKVRGLTGAERDRFEGSIVKMRGNKADVNMRNLRAKLVALSAVNGDGKRLFKTPDVDALGQKSAVALQRVFDVAQRLSGISDQDVEELAGNSDSAMSDGFTLG